MLGSRTRYRAERAEVVHVGLAVETEDGNGEFSFLGAVRNQNMKVVTYICDINVIAEKLFSALLKLFHIFFSSPWTEV